MRSVRFLPIAVGLTLLATSTQAQPLDKETVMPARKIESETAFAAQIAATNPDAAQHMVLTEAANPLIDFEGHIALAQEVFAHRRSRLVSHRQFEEMAARDDVLLLDARSAAAYTMGHIEGAANLPLPDFTTESLARVIGDDRDRPILIYCNNNFANNVAPVVTKILTVALNIQTMINLYGYGYRNVYELGEVVDFTDPQVRWAGTMMGAD